MLLGISPGIARQLPPAVRRALGRIPAKRQAAFEAAYRQKRRDTLLLGLLAIFFPIHFFFEGRIGLGLLYWLTFGGFGLWWLIEVITVWGRTARFNEDMATALLRDMQAGGMAPPRP